MEIFILLFSTLYPQCIKYWFNIACINIYIKKIKKLLEYLRIAVII